MSNGGAREILKGIGGCLLYIGLLVIFGFLIVMFFRGAGWLASIILPVSGWITLIALALVPICLILAIPRVTRAWGGLGLVISSYAIGLCLWLWSLVVAYQLAGMVWLIIGLCMAGVGVVLVAAIAALLQGEWSVLIQIIVGVVVVYVLRFFGNLLVEKAEPKNDYKPSPPEPPIFDEHRHENSPTMTMSEAEEILDITSRALQDQSDLHYHRLSMLEGYDVFQIDQALKLRIANEFLYFAGRDDGDEGFTEGLHTYSGIPFSIPTLFVADDELAKLKRLSPDSPEFFQTKIAIRPSMLDSEGNFKDARMASLETVESFGDFCRLNGASDPNYWKKVYERIGLEHTSASPQGNEYCYVAMPND